MSDDLSAFIADGIEFIVGGTIFLASLVFLLFSIGWEPVEGLPDLMDELGSGSSVLLFVIAAYAVGVLVEGVSRMIFERVLDRKTLRRKAFWHLPAMDVVDIPEAKPGERKKAWLGKREVWHSASEDHEQGEWIEEDFTNHDLALTVFIREYQRAYVMTAHLGLADEIGSQLKRLRLERVAFTSACVVFLGFLFSQSWWELLVWTGVLGVVLLVVLRRFDRYCSAIARGFVAGQTLKQKDSRTHTELPESESR
jgi:hypothetical protein